MKRRDLRKRRQKREARRETTPIGADGWPVTYVLGEVADGEEGDVPYEEDPDE